MPGRPVYLSDGPSRSYKVLETFTLEFKKYALKDVGFKTRERGLIVQALKALGKERLDAKVCKKILKETVTATGWIYDAIKRICKEGS